jgi:RHS repeat-associated protein
MGKPGRAGTIGGWIRKGWENWRRRWPWISGIATFAVRLKARVAAATGRPGRASTIGGWIRKWWANGRRRWRWIAGIAVVVALLGLTEHLLASRRTPKNVRPELHVTDAIAWRVQYDEQGRLVKSLDPAGRATTFAYAPADGSTLRSVTATPPEGPAVKWSFDGADRLASMTDGEGEVVYRYDHQGRLTAVERRGASAIRYAYDTVGRVVEVTVGDDYRLAWTYDFLGRVARLDTPAGPVGYDYQTGANTVCRSLPNGVTTYWKRQANGELEEITHRFSAKPDDHHYTDLARYSYDHGPDGRIATITEQSGQSEVTRRYSYGVMGRLTAVDGSDGHRYGYRYDEVGNRTQATETGVLDQICAYDWAGRLTSISGQPCRYDDCGNLAEANFDGDTRRYRYHPDGRLAEVRVGDQVLGYRYDGMGRLVARTDKAGETRFTPDPRSRIWRPLVIEEPGGARTLVIWDGEAPLALVRNGQTEWLLPDHLGSVRAVTDAAGQVVRQSDYDPYGVRSGTDDGSTLSPGYAGLFWDKEAGAQLTLARAYVPELGAFVQPDPEKRLPTASSESLALYSWCGSEPVNWVDRDGTGMAEAEAQAGPAPEVSASPVRDPVIQQAVDAAWADARAHGAGSPGEVATAADDLMIGWRYDPASYQRAHPTTVLPTEQEWECAENYSHKLRYDLTGQTHQGFAAPKPGDKPPAGRAGQSSGRVPSVPPGPLSFAMGELLSWGWNGAHAFGEATHIPPSKFFELASGGLPQDWHTPAPAHGNQRDEWLPQTAATWYWQLRATVRAAELMFGQDDPSRPLPPLPIPAQPVTGQPHDDALDQLRRANELRKRPPSVSQPPFWPGPPGPLSAWGGGRSDGWPGPSGGGHAGPGQPPPPPSPVGGVYLGGAATLAGLGTLQGVRVDAGGHVVLVAADTGDVKLPPLRLDDVVTVFRSVYLDGEGPTVTIDPDPKGPDTLPMHIVHSKATAGTYVGWVLYEADRLMKGYTLGRDNVTQQDVTSNVPGYRSVLDTMYFGGADPRAGQKGGVWERFWIVPAEARRYAGARHELTLFDVPLKVRTQKMKWTWGKLVDDEAGQSSAGALAFTTWFTTHYDEIAAERTLQPPPSSGLTKPVPVFTELRRIALLTAIAEQLRDQGVPLPFWMRDWPVQKIDFESTTPGMEVKRERQDGQITHIASIFGGVNLSPAPAAVKDYASAADTARAPQEQRVAVQEGVERAARIEQAVTNAVPVAPLAVRSVPDQEHTYQVAAMPGANTLALEPCRLDEVDLSVPVLGGGELTLIRRCNSFFQPDGPWGRGWTLDLPRLESVRIPTGGDGDRVSFMNGYEVVTPLNRVSARFKRFAVVPELGGSELLVPDAPGGFRALGADKPKFPWSVPTQVLILKDGSRWHFTKQGDLAAEEAGAQTTVYERSGSRLVRLVALRGGVSVAEIKLDYQGERLSKAVGRVLEGRRQAPVELSYQYDAEGRLSGVTTDAGTVGYTYQGPWVAAVTWTEPATDAKSANATPAAGAKTETLRSFQYNEHGQLTAETQGEVTTQHVVRAVEGGAEALQTTAVKDRPTGVTAKTRYDRQMRPVEATAPDGTVAKSVYAPDGSVQTTITEPGGRTTTLAQSSDGRQRTIQPADGATVVGEYDGAGGLVKLTADGQEVLAQQWRPDGQLASAQAGGQVLDLEYGQDRLLSRLLLHPPTDAQTFSEWQEARLDPRGNPVEIKDCRGLHVQLAYDAAGELTSAMQQTPDGTRGVNIERDRAGRLRAVRSSWGDTSYRYGWDGLLKQVKTRRGGAAAAVELAGGLVRKVTGFDGGTTTFDYYTDARLAGALRGVTCANGLELADEYDEQERLKAVIVGASRRVRLEYDQDGRVVGYVWEGASGTR